MRPIKELGIFTGIVYGKNDKWKLGAYYILEYDRDIYKNLDYLSGSVICHSFGKERDVKIDIDNPVFRKDGSVSMKSTSVGFTPIHTGIPSFVIPRQISLIINIHIHYASSSRATVFYIGEVTTLSAIHI
jgi:hypothetical protein